MTNKNSKVQNGNMIVIVAVAVAVFLGIALIASKTKTDSQISTDSTLPPVSERINPESASANKVFLEKAEAGNKLTIKEASFENDGYVYIYRDSAGKQTLVGKTQLLKAGTHKDLLVTLTANLKDGDIVYLSLIDKSGAKILDENKNAIEMQRNVGDAMIHYESEY